MYHGLRIIVINLLLVCASLILLCQPIQAQSVSVGKGSYSTVLPPSRLGPQNNVGQLATPKVSAEFSQLVNTNDYWSSLIFPYSGHNHTGHIFAHPLNFKSSTNGFELGYSPTPNVWGTGYDYPVDYHLKVGFVDLSSSRTATHAYGDWTFSAKMEFENASLVATTGHGLPYTFFEVQGGVIQITSQSESTIWYQQNEVIGLTVGGNHYGLFAPNGSTWTGTTPLQSTLNGKQFLSVAVLPDNNPETLEFFRKHAYAQVSDSKVNWEYNEATASMQSTFTYETVLKDSTSGNSNQTLTALYRHQWLNTSASFSNYTYQSPRGVMKVFEGNSFSTNHRFSGILPSLPDLGKYDRLKLLEFIQNEAKGELGIQDTYNSGKAMGRYADLIHIADQLGAVKERDFMLSELKERLEDWFTVGGDQEFSYNSTWNTLTGYPGSHGSSSQINDHHFHWGYAIKAAASIAMFDADWASQENWGGMVNMLVKDANNWDRSDTMLPFLRNFDPYAGHGWASGHGDFPNGNNQESSSESMNFATATILWGEITQQKEIRDLGIFLYTNENEAIEQYWFDINNEVFPQDYAYSTVGIVWGNGSIHTTWFGTRPEFIHGINMLPIHGASLYLGKNPDYILNHYNRIVSQLGSEPTLWKDIFWQYLAMADADLAIEKYLADPNYEPFDGNTRSNALHWLYNMKEMGRYNTQVTSNTPLYAVFVNASNDTTYLAYNAQNSDRTISFSDGFSMLVPSRTMSAHQTNSSQSTLIQAPVPTIAAEKVVSIFSDTYPSSVEAVFNTNEGQNTEVSIVAIRGNNTLKYSSLDRQSINLLERLNVISRTEFHIDYYTNDTDSLQIILEDTEGKMATYNVEITKSAWQSLVLNLNDFNGSFALDKLTKIAFQGNGTLYLDNIFFSGITAVSEGPNIAADHPLDRPDNVISLFSDTYSSNITANFNPFWNQQTEVSFISVEDNQVLKYSNLNYQGTEFQNAVDLSEMEWFHLNYWSSTTTTLKVYLISPGPQEKAFNITVKRNSWESIVIPLSEFSDTVNLSEVFQIKIEGDGTLYLDNLYFAKSPQLTAAPDPVHDADKVISLFSHMYENIRVDTWSAGWDRASVEDAEINGNAVKYYTNLDFAGVEFISQQINATKLTHFHFDMYTDDPTDMPSRFNVKLVDFGANGAWSGGDDVEHELSFNAENMSGFESGNWIRFDIPLDDFVQMTTRSNLSQILFVSPSTIKNVYIDNVYFYGNQVLSDVESEQTDIPTELTLNQNYPNPFNPSTQISYALPEATVVRLDVFNTLGQRMATLVDAPKIAGTHTARFDASLLPGGVYFYTLETTTSRITKKMLLLK